MNIVFSKSAWEDYKYWQTENPKITKKINTLIQDIERNGNQGLGKPEPLRYDFARYWSRRIDHEHRLIYKIEENQIQIISCRYHYEK